MFSLFTLSASLFFAPSAPTDLRVNLLRHPDRAVITNPDLRFGWVVNDLRPKAEQGAYEIEVDLWDGSVIWKSKVIRSNESVQSPYSGPPLRTGVYKWKVRSGDKGGKMSPWSELQQFEIRLPDTKDKPRSWPAESHWVKAGDNMFLEDRQCATIVENKQVSLQKIDDKRWVVDFGKAAFGTMSFGLSTKTVLPLRIRMGERKAGDGGVDPNVGKSSISYIEHDVMPEQDGTYHVRIPRHIGKYPHSQAVPEFMDEVIPFRYAEIIGVPPESQPTNISQLALIHDFDDTSATFYCSNKNLEKVWRLCKYTLKATPFLSLYCDGNRERMPYEADSYIQQLGHFSVDSEYTAANYTLAFLLHHASWPTEWQSHTIFMAWDLWMNTGDLSTARKFYPILYQKTLLALAAKDNLISTRKVKPDKEFLKAINLEQRDLTDIVDWPAGERDAFVMTDYNCVVNAFHIASLRKLSDIAAALGKFQDSASLRKRAGELTVRFNEVFFDKATGIYRDGIGTDHSSLHANMFPLAFGLTPEINKKSVVEFVKRKGMACSVYGSQYLLEALYGADQADAAMQLMTDESDRSWMHMIDLGTTMTMEAWDEKYKPNLTWNHAWGSAPANIIPRKIFGIEPMEPGFASVRIRPQFGKLKQASIKLPTIRGPILVDWDVDAKVKLKVTLPANMKGEIMWQDKTGKDQSEEIWAGPNYLGAFGN